MGDVIDFVEAKKARQEQPEQLEENKESNKEDQKMEIIDKRWEGILKAKLHGVPDATVNVKQYRKSYFIDGAGSALDELEEKLAEEKAGTLSSGEESPEEVTDSIKEKLDTNHLELEEDLKLIEILDLVFKKVGMDNIYMVDNSDGKKGFDTRKLGNVENFDDMTFVVPFGLKDEILKATSSVPAGLSEPMTKKFNEMTRNMMVDDLNFMDKETGFSIKFGSEKITFLYGGLENNKTEKEIENKKEEPEQIAQAA